MGLHHGQANFVTYGKPSLFLDFANKKSLTDRISGNNLIDFTRASTGTYVGADGLIKTAAVNEPRFDHDSSTGESLGLLIEESRTNLVPYSNNLTASTGWRNVSLSNMTAQNVSHPAPDGSNTVTELTGGGTNSWWAKDINYLQNTTYTVSAYVKVADGGANFSAQFNLYTTIGGGLAEGSPFTITSEWKRVSNIIGTTSVTGIETVVVKTNVSGRKFYIWGIQVEQGFCATSYIPTSASTVTRSSDTARITGNNFSSWYNQSEGSFIFNTKTFEQDTNNNYYGETGDGTNNNRNIMYSSTTAGSALYYYITNGTAYVNTLNAGYPYQLNTYVKVGYCYKENDFGVFAPGGLSNNDTGGILHTANSFAIGTNNTGFVEHLNGHLKQLIYYPTRLTNAQLQSLTS